MCVILLAPKGTDKKSEFLYEAIKTGAITNTDGIGLMYKEGDSIYVDKGYKSAEEIIEVLEKLSLSNDHGELAIHLRIGNKGHVNAEMCHPFICSHDEEETMSLQSMTKKPVMMHNGTFTGLTLPTGKSDTFVFANQFLSEKHVVDFMHAKPELFLDLAKSLIGPSRVLVFYPDHRDHAKIGTWIEDNGYYFSNESYKNARYRNVGGVGTHLPSKAEEVIRKKRSKSSYKRSQQSLPLPTRLLSAPKQTPSSALFDDLINEPIAGGTFIGYTKRLVREDYLSTSAFKSGIVRNHFEDEAGYEYSAYKGLFRNVNDSRALADHVTIEPFINKFNFKFFTLQAKVTDSMLGISDGRLYKIVSILKNPTTFEFLATINRAVGAIMEDSIYVNINDIPKYFSITPKNDSIAKDIFLAYLDAVSVFNDNRKYINKLAKDVKGKSDLTLVSCGAKNTYMFPAVVIKWYIYETKRFNGEPIKRILQVLQEND